jgi:hypothetical protein
MRAGCLTETRSWPEFRAAVWRALRQGVCWYGASRLGESIDGRRAMRVWAHTRGTRRQLPGVQLSMVRRG